MGNSLTANHKIPKKTSAEWERLNPIIFEKELIAVETANTGIRFKLGDGVRRYNQLPFVDEALYSTLSAKADKTYVEELISEIDVHGNIAIHNADPNAHSTLLEEYATKEYVDDAIENIPIPDVSEQIAEHNAAADAHEALFDNKVDKVAGKGLSSNDFTDEYKAILDDGPYGKVVQSDWEQDDATADDYIKNKPIIATDFDIVMMLANSTSLTIYGEDDDIFIDENGNIYFTYKEDE